MNDGGAEGLVEGSGRAVEEAVQAALGRLGVRVDDAVVEVVDVGGRGWFGLGAKPARARARRVTKGEAAERFLTRLGAVAAAPLRVRVTPPGGDEVWAVMVECDDPGRWIGKHGHALDALHHVCEAAAARASGDRRRLVLDVDGYRERRERALEEMARRAAQQVRRGGREVALEPMSAADRRIVHLAVQGVAGVRSESAGEEPHRRVVIVPDSQGA